MKVKSHENIVELVEAGKWVVTGGRKQKVIGEIIDGDLEEYKHVVVSDFYCK